MKIECGPAGNIRTLNFELPNISSRIAVCISGGIDSAIMYYLILEENRRLGNLHKIVPVTVLREEGSKHFANLVVGHVLASFGKQHENALVLGDPSLPDDQQVRSAVRHAHRLGFDRTYVGIIDELPEHYIGWTRPDFPENDFFKTPLSNLQKLHVLNLVIQFNQQELFHITHACCKFPIGRCGACNGCNERRWGFNQLALIDPSML